MENKVLLGPLEVLDQLDIPDPREWQESPAQEDPPENKDQMETPAVVVQLEREELQDRLDHLEMMAHQEGMESLVPLVPVDHLVHRVAE